MYDLTRFTLKEMTACGAALRKLGSGAASMEEAADRLIRYLYDYLVDQQTGAKTCAWSVSSKRIRTRTWRQNSRSSPVGDSMARPYRGE